jgi:hypothetical protein
MFGVGSDDKDAAKDGADVNLGFAANRKCGFVAVL